MKILLAHNHYQHAGGEDQVFAQEAALLTSRGHEVMTHTVHNDEVNRLGGLQLACATVWNRAAYRELRSLLRRERPQVMHVHNTLPLLSPAIYHAAKAENIAVVQTLHNFRLLCSNALLLRDGRVCEDCVGKVAPIAGVLHGCYRGSRAASAAVAGMLVAHRVFGTWASAIDVYIALTEFARTKFIAGGLPPERIELKPNFLYPDPGMGPHSGGFALFVGRVSAEKGLDTLIGAFQRLAKPVPLKIVGSGPHDRWSSMDIAGVEWLGTQPKERVLALMKDAAFLVFPSVWYEGFPMTLTEAFAVGLPVLASRLGAMAEIVEDGQTGLHFNSGDPKDLAAKIRWAVEHPEEMRQMGENVRREYEARYTAEQNYQLLMGIYELAVERAARVRVQKLDRSVFQRAGVQVPVS